MILLFLIYRLYKESEGGLTLEDIAHLFQKDIDENTKEKPEDRVDINRILNPYSSCETTEEVTKQAQKILEDDLNRAKEGRNIVKDLGDDGVFVALKLMEENWLKGEEEKRYRDEWETMVMGYVAAAPVLTGERLLALMEAGRVKIVKVSLMLFSLLLLLL